MSPCLLSSPASAISALTTLIFSFLKSVVHLSRDHLKCWCLVSPQTYGIGISGGETQDSAWLTLQCKNYFFLPQQLLSNKWWCFFAYKRNLNLRVWIKKQKEMEMWIQTDFSLFCSWMTSRHWAPLGFNLKEQEERNNVQSKIKMHLQKKKEQENHKASCLLIWFLGPWHETNVQHWQKSRWFPALFLTQSWMPSQSWGLNQSFN